MNKKGKKSSAEDLLQAEEDLCRDLDEILLGLDSFQKLSETEVSNLPRNHAKMQDRAKQGSAPRVKNMTGENLITILTEFAKSGNRVKLPERDQKPWRFAVYRG